jgi:hypothetical protein
MVAKVPALLAEHLGQATESLLVRTNPAQDKCQPDLVIHAGQTFVIEVRKSTAGAAVTAVARHAKDHAARESHDAIPLVVLPFMGEAGRQACEEAGVCWLDLSGNAHIVAPGLRIIIEGRPNRFKALGRPRSTFAPKSARLVRWLLMHAGESFTQRELAHATGLDEGMVSRLAGRLIEDEYLVRNERGAVRVHDPDLLLDAWRADNRFTRHRVHQGHVVARSGEELLRTVADAAVELGIDYAATGLAAAWSLTHFASFRLVTLYLPSSSLPGLRDRLGFRDDPRGSNLWLVAPDDAGVFEGAADRDGIRCAHPLQVYVDLKGHPERAPEAAERLREEYLRWKRGGEWAGIGIGVPG